MASRNVPQTCYLNFQCFFFCYNLGFSFIVLFMLFFDFWHYDLLEYLNKLWSQFRNRRYNFILLCHLHINLTHSMSACMSRHTRAFRQQLSWNIYLVHRVHYSTFPYGSTVQHNKRKVFEIFCQVLWILIRKCQLHETCQTKIFEKLLIYVVTDRKIFVEIRFTCVDLSFWFLHFLWIISVFI